MQRAAQYHHANQVGRRRHGAVGWCSFWPGVLVVAAGIAACDASSPDQDRSGADTRAAASAPTAASARQTAPSSKVPPAAPPSADAPAATAERKSAAPAGSCMNCHADPKFLVENKKLHDYYRDFLTSAHYREGVMCADCHGGNPNAPTKDAAHAKMSIGSSSAGSAVSFRKVPETCSRCHSDVYDAYVKSKHYEKLNEKTGVVGPNCVTCHGSMNAGLLDSASVREICAQCHNAKTKNVPELPERAAKAVRRFRILNTYYRFITLRSKDQEGAAFLKEFDPQHAKLAADWHTFNLDTFEERTEVLLAKVLERVELIRQQRGNPALPASAPAPSP